MTAWLRLFRSLSSFRPHLSVPLPSQLVEGRHSVLGPAENKAGPISRPFAAVCFWLANRSAGSFVTGGALIKFPLGRGSGGGRGAGPPG